ncbi:hypothetical protein PtA15_2A279 [Puccinia triticina]|uniref:Uncharacterized protein n=1 Tax=Puccinia triticina TaxID=208348 RepID=A0ABY7C9W8_9BASI|nr:uncharacterized protein PtA15_2A279 [Puccinia triticina]WAQ81966.1 hypothetical protein PtA15_2A279 [Puccinia triticina]
MHAFQKACIASAGQCTTDALYRRCNKAYIKADTTKNASHRRTDACNVINPPTTTAHALNPNSASNPDNANISLAKPPCFVRRSNPDIGYIAPATFIYLYVVVREFRSIEALLSSPRQVRPFKLPCASARSSNPSKGLALSNNQRQP